MYSASRGEHPDDLGEYPRLVRGEIEHAVRDNDIHRPIFHGKLLDVALAHLYVVVPSCSYIPARAFQHLVRHVHTDHPAFRAHLRSGQQQVYSRPATQVQNCLTNLEVTERNGVPTAKGVLDRVLGQSLQAGSFVARTLRHNPLPIGVRTAAGTAAPSFTGPADRTRVRL